jgi:hypothetical protein
VDRDISLHATVPRIRSRKLNAAFDFTFTGTMSIDLTDRQKTLILNAMSKVQPQGSWVVTPMSYSTHVHWTE